MLVTLTDNYSCFCEMKTYFFLAGSGGKGGSGKEEGGAGGAGGSMHLNMLQNTSCDIGSVAGQNLLLSVW